MAKAQAPTDKARVDKTREMRCASSCLHAPSNSNACSNKQHVSISLPMNAIPIQVRNTKASGERKAKM
jgi:hypothetical protein